MSELAAYQIRTREVGAIQFDGTGVGAERVIATYFQQFDDASHDTTWNYHRECYLDSQSGERVYNASCTIFPAGSGGVPSAALTLQPNDWLVNDQGDWNVYTQAQFDGKFQAIVAPEPTGTLPQI